MEHPTCKTCGYFGNEGEGQGGLCHRHSPTPGPNVVMSRPYWPPVDPADWCGDHPAMADYIRKNPYMEPMTRAMKDYEASLSDRTKATVEAKIGTVGDVVFSEADMRALLSLDAVDVGNWDCGADIAACVVQFISKHKKSVLGETV